MITDETKSRVPVRILILGMGDLGQKIAHLVALHGLSSVCMLAGQSGEAEQWAQLLRISSGRNVRGARVDGQDREAVKRLLEDFQPDLIVQCATLLSPFALTGVGTEVSKAVLAGGFALQASAQLLVIRTLMEARQELGMRCPVVNCSYPDVTNAVLAAVGLAPDVGIGNVAIMALRFERLIAGAWGKTLHVVGHHAQLGASLTGRRAEGGMPVPLVYLEGRLLGEEEVLFDTGLQAGSTLNHLAAATALTVIRGLVEVERTLDTHAPGVFGLPGGYPVRFAGGLLSLRLPEGVRVQDAVRFNQLAAAGEGVKAIGEDGTLFYTDSAKAAVAAWCPGLAEPLRLDGLESRMALLRGVLES